MQKLLYEAACEILTAEKEKRSLMLQKVPELIRPHVEAEVWRVWRMRNEV
jgi:hypothetical protein